MKTEYYTDEERHLAFGAGRSLILEIRQRARAIGDRETADQIDLALDHLDKVKPPRPGIARDDTLIAFPRALHPTNALLALNRRGGQ